MSDGGVYRNVFQACGSGNYGSDAVPINQLGICCSIKVAQQQCSPGSLCLEDDATRFVVCWLLDIVIVHWNALLSPGDVNLLTIDLSTFGGRRL